MSTATPTEAATVAPDGSAPGQPRRALGLTAAARVVANREVATTLRDRGFLISTLVTLVIVAGVTAPVAR